MPSGIYERTKPRGGWKIEDTSNMKGSHPKSEFKKGRVPWNKGKKLSEEHKKKLSEAKTGKTPWNKGRYGINAGKDNPNWRGGSSFLYRARRTSRYKNWRNKVFERDNYTCQLCGRNECYVTAHHLKSVTRRPDLIYSVDNGQTLCESCHAKTDNYKGRARRK